MTEPEQPSVERARVKASLLRSMFKQDAAPPSIGRFSVLQTLGRGGMGVVYRAYDPQLRREVAIKLLSSGPDDGDSQGRARLLREAQAMARLSHPNVLPVFEAGQHDGRVFMVMELVEGGTLLDWQGEERSWSEVLEIYVQAARGLQAAHAAGLVHRDFKPHNVLVSEGARARVMDFGLARPAAEAVETAADSVPDGDVGELDTPLTRTGTVLGTPAYMSPEQHRGEAADERSDQFSFCVALWEALHGNRPFAGKTMAALLAAIEDGQREAPSGSNVPSGVRRVLERGLAPDPQQRWPSLDALADALQEQRPKPRAGTSRAWWGLGAVALAAVTLVGLRGNSGPPKSPCPPIEEALAGVGRASQAWDGDEVPPHLRQAKEHLVQSQRDWIEAFESRYAQTCQALVDNPPEQRTVPLLELQCLQEVADDMRATEAGLHARTPAQRVSLLRTYEGAGFDVMPASDCDDETWLRRRPAPASGSDRAEAIAISRLVANAYRQHGFGDPGEVANDAREAVTRARALGHEPTLARALQAWAWVGGQLGHLDDAHQDELRAEAIRVAESCGADRLAATLLLWEARDHLFEQQDPSEALDRAKAAFVRGGSLPRQHLDFLEFEAMVARERGKLEQEIALRRQTADEARDQGETAREVFALHQLSWTLGRAAPELWATPTERREVGERALALGERMLGAEHPSLIPSLLQITDFTFWNSQRTQSPDDLAEARSGLERLIAIAETDGQRTAALGRAKMQIGMVRAFGYDDFLGSVAAQREGLTIFEEVYGPDHPVTVGFVAQHLLLTIGLGDHEAALAELPRLQKAMPPSGIAGPKGQTVPTMVHVLRMLEAARGDDLAQTLEHAARAHEAAKHAGRGDMLAAATLFELEALRLLGDRTVAPARAEASLQADFTGAPWPVQPGINVLAGLIFIGSGDPARALPLFEEAEAIYGAHGNPEGLARPLADLHYGLSRALSALGRDPRRARAAAQEAVRWYGKLDAQHADERARAEAWLSELSK